jgi:Mg/Co/Ni transporter MgtE
MSPRAAWRLDGLGFHDVSDYMAGKLDWMAAGLPTEGTNSQRPRAADIARKDSPTCGLDERLGAVRDRVREQGWESVVVVNEQRIVLGLLRSKELAGDADKRIEEAMRPAPSTFRPHVDIHELAHSLVEHKLENAPITTSDGRLVGLILTEDALKSLRESL